MVNCLMYIVCNCDIVFSQPNVMMWLDSLKLSQYKPLFKTEGYYTDEDVENLKGLTKADLQSMGITRRGNYYFLNIYRPSSRVGRGAK